MCGHVLWRITVCEMAYQPLNFDGSFKPHLHDTTCRQWDVKPYSVSQLSNRFNNRLNVSIDNATGCQAGLTHTCCIVYTTSCQSGCTNRFDNRLKEQWLFIKPVVQPVWQPAVSCIQPVVQPGLTSGWMNSACSFSRLSNRLYNPSDNRTTGLTTGFATSCFVRSCVFLHWNAWTVLYDA